MNVSDLLHDAVDDIEPADRIDAIRARTASAPTRAARPWFHAAGGVVLATAATVAAFAVLDDSPPPDHGSMTMPTGTQVVPVYFTGRDAAADRLFREFDTVPAGDPAQAALDRLQQPPTDPDYATSWTPGAFGKVTVDGRAINVELDVNDLSDRLAVQQVVYTVQAAVGERLPVYFWLEGQRGNAPYMADPGVLSPVLISDPSDGLAVHGHVTARGAAPAGGPVRWEVRRDDGTVVAHGAATISGRAWRARVGVHDLPFGFYTFVASVGPDSDTRTIIVR
ncbi:MAG TPA: GerMN domain-containing protein [Nocardioides sp.]|nr:GerMN domain-containing protein [Nocardioides sp.]